MLRDVIWLIGIIAVLAVVLFGSSTVAWLDAFERPEIIVSATISVVGTGFAAVFGYFLWLQQHRADIAREDRRYEQRRRTLMIALRAELGEYAEAFFAQYDPAQVSEFEARLTKTLETAKDGEHSMPMAVVVKETVILGSLKSEIMDLPGEVLSPLIRYQQLSENTNELLSAFSSSQFEKVSLERRKGALKMLFSMGKESTEAAIDAFVALHYALGLEMDVAADRISQMNAAFDREPLKLLKSNDNNGASE